MDFSRADIYPPKAAQALPPGGSWWRTVRSDFAPRAATSIKPVTNQALPDSLSCKIYLLTVLIETAVDLTIEGDLLIRIHQANDEDSQSGLSTTSRKMPIYLTIFSLAQYVARSGPSPKRARAYIFIAFGNSSLPLMPSTPATPFSSSPLRESVLISH